MLRIRGCPKRSYCLEESYLAKVEYKQKYIKEIPYVSHLQIAAQNYNDSRLLHQQKYIYIFLSVILTYIT